MDLLLKHAKGQEVETTHPKGYILNFSLPVFLFSGSSKGATPIFMFNEIENHFPLLGGPGRL